MLDASGYEQVLHCNLCGDSKNRTVDEPGHIVQCTNCDLRFVSPRPTQRDISGIYDENYGNDLIWGKLKPESQLMYRRRFDFVNRFVREGRILDVGAGRGEFLSLAKNMRDWQCFGTETSEYAIGFARGKFGLELSLGQLEDLAYAPNSFDAVTFWHTLEHLPFPAKAIKEAGRILKDDGFLFIAVPNDSWLGRKHFFKNAFKKAINRLPLRKKLKLKKMYPEVNEKSEKHLFYFTPRTLSALLKKQGFRIKEYSVDYDYEETTDRFEKTYRFNRAFCRLTGINLGNAILIAAQKTSYKEKAEDG